MPLTAMPRFIDESRYKPVFTTDFLISQTDLPLKRRRFEAGEHAFLAQERCPTMFHVVKGLFKLHLMSPEGASKTLFFHASGTQFGFQGFRSDKRTISFAVAVCPSEALVIRYDDLLRYCDAHTEYYLAFIEYLFQIMNSQTQEIASLSFQTGLRRLAELLYALACDAVYTAGWSERDGTMRSPTGDGPIAIYYTVEELAEMIGAHRNTVSNALGTLRKLGLVTARVRPIEVSNIERLESYLEE